MATTAAATTTTTTTPSSTATAIYEDIHCLDHSCASFGYADCYISQDDRVCFVFDIVTARDSYDDDDPASCRHHASTPATVELENTMLKEHVHTTLLPWRAYANYAEWLFCLRKRLRGDALAIRVTMRTKRHSWPTQRYTQYVL